MKTIFKMKAVVAAVVFCLTMMPSLVQAGEITLTSDDGTVALTGQFVGFRDLAYVIMIRDHELHVPVNMMNCYGADCLNLEIIEFVDETTADS